MQKPEIDPATKIDEFQWTACDPSATTLDEVVCAQSLSWPGWEWRSLVEVGVTSRQQGIDVADALEMARRSKELPPFARNMILAAWLRLGILKARAD